MPLFPTGTPGASAVPMHQPPFPPRPARAGSTLVPWTRRGETRDQHRARARPDGHLPCPEREALAGLVERVTDPTPATGFGVLRVKVRGQRDLVTVVGAAAISAGEFVQASGVWA